MDDTTALYWIEKALSVSLFLVAIGVAGEFVGNWIAAPVRKRLETAKDLEIARLNKEAGDARKAAGDAMERAADLETQAESERLARVKLEQRIASRQITPKQHAAFVAALRPYQGSQVLVTKLGDAEAGQFAEDLLKVLRDANWSVMLQIKGFITPSPYGLQCAVNDSTPAGKALGAILKSLPTATVVSDTEMPKVATIVVGLKPPA